MCPTSSIYNISNGRPRNAEYFCEFISRERTLANKFNVVLTEFTTRILNTLIVISTLLFTILHVIGISTDIKMLGVNARWIIATMKNLKTRWNQAVMNNPRSTVRATRAVTCTTESVIFRMSSADPQPACFSLFNLTKEIFSRSDLTHVTLIGISTGGVK